MKLTRNRRDQEREQELWALIGTRLRIARKAALLSQAAMAEKLGISLAKWSMYERGRRPIRMIHLDDCIKITAVSWSFVMEGNEHDVAKDVRSRMRAARQLEGDDNGAGGG